MVIVIGATGFIGLYTVEKLIQEGYEVIGTGRNKVTMKMLEDMGAQTLELDITNKADFDKLPTEGVDGVFLMAGLLPANATVDITQDENAADYVSVFILPPSFEDLRVRLHTRNTDDPVEIERRLNNARGEVQKVDRYQYAVVNDDLELAFSQLQSIVNAEKLRTKRCKTTIIE